MPNLGIIASQISGHLWSPGTDFDSIATVTISTTGIQEVVFSSIPQTYRHLQLRVMSKADVSNTPENYYLQMSGDTGYNYTQHEIVGNGSTATAAGTGSGGNPGIGTIPVPSNNEASIFGVTIMDILDYTNTNKYTTARYLNGWDGNGSGQIALKSGVWLNTAAVTSLRWWRPTNIKPNSTFALYGIK